MDSSETEVKKMKLYKVTITDQFNEKCVYTVSAKSELDALIELRATSICAKDIVSAIEEVS